MELIFNILIGLLSGIYAGLIVARMTKFEELRNEARRIIWGIDYISIDNSPPQVIKISDIDKLTYISSELYYLKHKKAGNNINILRNTINHVIIKPPATSDDMNRYYETWQKMVRTLKPNMLTILSIKSWL